MSSLLEEATPRTATSPAEQLRATMAAVRVSVRWFGTRRTLTSEQKAEAADTFGAEQSFLSAAKKLIDTSDPSFKAVTSVRNKAIAFWRSLTLPFPENGLRLIRQEKVDAFVAQMQQFQAELEEAVAILDRRYHQLKSTARQRLGRLYSDADYPASLTGLFHLDFDFPSVEVPSYLRQLNPELYQQECQRVQARFDEAVHLAEEAFCAELAKLISHLTERLSGTDDGKPKQFFYSDP
ncbi:MAG: hypothetical protein WCK89_19705 [bacterium]